MKKLENNWRSKTLENLEKEFWGEPEYASSLVSRVHEIRRIPLNKLTNDDIAMMLRQKFGLAYIVPLAIDKLQADILACGDSSDEGAIMETVLRIPATYWKSSREQWFAIDKILQENSSDKSFDRREFDVLGF